MASPFYVIDFLISKRIFDILRNSGFEVGSTTQACTKGIWMWNQPISINDQVDAILLDTEGLGSTE